MTRMLQGDDAPDSGYDDVSPARSEPKGRPYSSDDSKSDDGRSVRKGIGAAGRQLNEQSTRDLYELAASERSNIRYSDDKPRYVNVDQYRRGGKIRKSKRKAKRKSRKNVRG